ncbi:hypothetical protein [Chamaesiphon sp.]|uniref:hypothetical protein n=1 Tax=Chamaesiphon sp. TaxID=2814140 RepID=UPI0035942D32
MGDAKRKKLICNAYRLEPYFTGIETLRAGASVEIEDYIKAQEKNDLDPKSEVSGAILKLIKNLDPDNKNLILCDPTRPEAIIMTSSSEYIENLKQRQDSLTETAISEVDKILGDYDPRQEIIVASFLSTAPKYHTIDYKCFIVIMKYKFEYRNIYY